MTRMAVPGCCVVNRLRNCRLRLCLVVGAGLGFLLHAGPAGDTTVDCGGTRPINTTRSLLIP